MDIYKFIYDLNIKIFIEIGCHFGEDTRRFRKMHPLARIIGFEPDPRNIKIICDTGIDRICEFHPIALSNKTESRQFFMSSGSAGDRVTDQQHRENDWTSSSSLKVPTGHLEEHKWITFPTFTLVQCRRLDDIESLHGAVIDFIWADVQGAEDLVFSGAKDTLTRTRYVYTEYGTNLYEGQLSRDQLITLFGPKWSVVHDFGGDILLKNMAM